MDFTPAIYLDFTPAEKCEAKVSDLDSNFDSLLVLALLKVRSNLKPTVQLFLLEK